MSTRRNTQKLTSAFKIVLACGIIFWLIHSHYLNFADLKRALNPVYLPLAVFCILMMLLCAAERFRHLLKAQGVFLTFGHNFEIFFIGQFFNYILPGGVGGDVVKAFYIHQDVGQRAKTSPYTVLFDRFIGFFVLSALAMIVIIFHWSQFRTVPKLRAVSIFVFIEFLSLLLLIVLGFWRKSRELIVRLVPQRLGPVHKFTSYIASSCEFYASNPRCVLRAFAWGVLMQIFAIFALAAVVTSVNIVQLPLSAYFFIGPLGFIVNSLPISPGGIGVGQAGFLFFFDIYLGHRSAIGPIAITVIQIISFCWSLIGLYLYLARKGRRTGAKVTAPTAATTPTQSP